MGKILKAYRAYNKKQWLKKFFAIGIPTAAVIGALWAVDILFLDRFVFDWLFIVLYVVFAAVIVKTLITALKTRPERLERHLYAISEKDRNAIISEFDESNSENGRFFLTDFLLLFTDGGGIIRYAKIGEVSVIGKAIWLASGKKAAMLKAKNKEEALEVAKKIQSRIPDDVVVEDEEPDEEQIKARETDKKILREIVGVPDSEEDSGEDGGEDDVEDNGEADEDDSGESE